MQVPPSKYHLHRALIFGSLAEGDTQIHGRSDARHIRYTVMALRALGTRIVRGPEGYTVSGGPYVPRRGRVGVGSSGSTLQFLLGLGCRSVRGPVVFNGQKYFRNRPIGPLLRALAAMGVRLEAGNERVPVTVYPGQPRGGTVVIPGLLSQWVSGLLMVAPFARTTTRIHVEGIYNERTYVELTRRMLAEFGIRVEADPSMRRWVVPPEQTYRPRALAMEPDLSSAAFPLVLAALHPADVTLEGIDGPGDHPEGRILDVVQQMGIPLQIDAERRRIRIYHGGERPHGTSVDMRDIPDLLPILCVLASVARGRSVLRNVTHARLKESDRVRSMLQLRRMGARIEERGEDLVIEGVERLEGADVSSYNDHRVLMALAVAGSVARGDTRISYPHAYRISYPEFLLDMAAIGMRAEVETVESAHVRGLQQ